MWKTRCNWLSLNISRALTLRKDPPEIPSFFGQHEIFPLAAMGPEKEVDRTLKGETIC
jgi:hypothetical protein